jgi:signal peptidase I
MLPNLLVGDYLFVSKYSYGYSRYSLPFSPNIFEGRIFKKQPKRGDVVVFRLPKDPSIDYIKRIIGLPGDEIIIVNGTIYINDGVIEQAQSKNRDKYFSDYPKGRLLIEKIPQKSYKILNLEDNGIGDNAGVYVVPEDHYFFMGDNRDNSLDSRFLDQVGYVSYDNLIGRAEFLFFSSDKSIPLWKFWQWHKKFRADRIFKKII